MGVRVGIDTGGTFTDLVAVDEESGRWFVSKVPSNPRDPVAAVSAALEAAAFDPAAVSFVVVGTTIGINAVLTRSGARVLYLTTKGFEDIPFIQRISRKYHYDYTWRKPTPLVHRPDCIGVTERGGAGGCPARAGRSGSGAPHRGERRGRVRPEPAGGPSSPSAGPSPPSRAGRSA